MNRVKPTDANATARILYSESVKPLDTVPSVVTHVAATRDDSTMEDTETENKLRQVGTTQTEPQVISNGISSIRLDGGKVTITACEELSFACGEATFTLKKDGTIEIQGVSKALIAGGESAMELSTSGATLTAPAVNVSSAETTQITGKLVKIN